MRAEQLLSSCCQVTSIQARKHPTNKPAASNSCIAPIFTFRLPQNLVHALGDIAAALPDLLEDIQGQLLDLLSLILSGKPFSPLTKGKAVQGLVHSLSMSELSAPEQTKLALNTIGLMDFGRVSEPEVVDDVTSNNLIVGFGL